MSFSAMSFSARALCTGCGRRPGATDTCDPFELIELDGSRHRALPYGRELEPLLRACLVPCGIPMARFVERVRSRRCRKCGVSLGNFHHRGCSEEGCPRCGRLLSRCPHFAAPRAADPLERLASVLGWLALAAHLDDAPDDYLLLALNRALLGAGPREFWKDLRRGLPLFPRRLREPPPEPSARHGICDTCGRDGLVQRCGSCGDRFHHPRCDGYRTPGGDLACFSCAASEPARQRVAMAQLARVLYFACLAASSGE
jgi:hypothetical protein